MSHNADMAVASPQSAARPAATRAACVARLSPVGSRHRFIIDFAVASRMPRHVRVTATLMVFSGQQIPQGAPSLGQSSPKGEKIRYPQVCHPTKFHRPASTYLRSAYKNVHRHKQ